MTYYDATHWLVRISLKRLSHNTPDWVSKTTYSSPWAAVRELLERVANEVDTDWLSEEITIKVERVR